MSFEMDDEILQDFLVEAGEILEKLGEQLVELEHRPEDRELLNAVFRGFHTVKGGAGFLNIASLVEVCHRAEDVFNTLRQGQRNVDAALMDAVLKVTDVVNGMMDAVRNGVEPEGADPELLERLKGLAAPQSTAEVADNGREAVAVVAAENNAPVSGVKTKDPVEQQFEELLSVSNAGANARDPATSAQSNEQATQIGEGGGSDEISEAEFEALLDQLHGPKPSVGTKTSSGGGSDPVRIAAEPHVIAAASATIANAHGNDLEPAGKDLAQQGNIRRDGKVSEDEEGSGSKQHPATRDASHQLQMETTVRVDTKRLDDIMNLVGELVLVRNRLDTLKLNIQNEQVAQAVSNLDVVTSDLQSAVMKTRMQPIKKVFGRFPRVVRDLSRALKKEINLELVGEDTDLDKNLVDALADPLVHLVRNAVDHGIEAPELRLSAGKPKAGTITLSARQEGDHISLVIKDDGAGMNAEHLRNLAVKKGLMDAEVAARLDQRECYNLIFMPGFSTKSEISDISGRGVGMDVVKTRITQLNGSVEVDSREGSGTEIKINLPLTLAIVPTLMVMVGKQIFAIPLANVSEIIQCDSVKKNMVDGQVVAIVRDHPLPLFYLRNWLLRDAGDNVTDPQSSYIVVIKVGMSQHACVVDHLIAQEEVVIKPLGALLHGLPGLAGATITGDGRIAVILDMPNLISRYARRLN